METAFVGHGFGCLGGRMPTLILKKKNSLVINFMYINYVFIDYKKKSGVTKFGRSKLCVDPVPHEGTKFSSSTKR